MFKKRKAINLILLVASFFLCTLVSTGYAALSQSVQFTGKVNYKRYGDVRLINATYKTATNGGSQTAALTYVADSIAGTISLPNIDSTVTYNVTVKNYTK